MKAGQSLRPFPTRQEQDSVDRIRKALEEARRWAVATCWWGFQQPWSFAKSQPYLVHTWSTKHAQISTNNISVRDHFWAISFSVGWVLEVQHDARIMWNFRAAYILPSFDAAVEDVGVHEGAAPVVAIPCYALLHQLQYIINFLTMYESKLKTFCLVAQTPNHLSRAISLPSLSSFVNLVRFGLGGKPEEFLQQFLPANCNSLKPHG